MDQRTESLVQGLEGPLRDLVREMIVSTSAELDGPIRKTAGLLAQAATAGKPELVAAARDQLMLLLLQQKIVAKAGFKAVFDRVLLTGMNLLVNGAIAGLASVKV